MKYVALRPDIDLLNATVITDDRWSGASPSDLAALEIALQIAQRLGGEVVVASVGPSEAEMLLRDALACGAGSALRIQAHADGQPHDDGYVQPNSRAVAESLARVFAGFDLVICGDWSLDRGSASVPVFLAAALGYDDACGLVRIDTENLEPGSDLHAERRLDGGRRERLTISGPAVLSVEGSTARIRRASLSGVLAARSANIEVVTAVLPTHEPEIRFERTLAFRPPARHMSSPSSTNSPLSRVSELMGVSTNRTPPTRLELDPEAAADLIIERVRSFDATR